MKLPPILVFALPVLLGWAASAVFPAVGFGFAGQEIIALAAFGAGALLLFLAVTGFRLKKTTVNPLEPSQASALVADGIYRISRNPMYLGMALCAFGVSVYGGHTIGLILLPLAIIYINQVQIKPEEKALSERFGKDYEMYCHRVRRWI